MAGSAAAACLLVAAAVAVATVHAAEPAGWGPYKQGVQSMRVGAAGDSVGEQLGPALDWNYDAPLDSVRRGQAFVGPNRRLRRVAADWLAGKPVEVAIMGGSISTGAVASRKMDPVDPNDSWSLVRLYMQKTNPATAFNNNARSATKSYIYSQCLPRFLNATADLVGAPSRPAARPGAPPAAQQLLQPLLLCAGPASPGCRWTRALPPARPSRCPRALTAQRRRGALARQPPAGGRSRGQLPPHPARCHRCSLNLWPTTAARWT